MRHEANRILVTASIVRQDTHEMQSVRVVWHRFEYALVNLERVFVVAGEMQVRRELQSVLDRQSLICVDLMQLLGDFTVFKNSRFET